MIHVLKVAGGSIVELYNNHRKLTIFWDLECYRNQDAAGLWMCFDEPTTLETAEDALAAWEWLHEQ